MFPPPPPPADDNGYLSQTELRSLLAVVGRPCSEDEAAAFFKQVDSNNDGRIDFGEFVYMLSNLPPFRE
jgi:Ca2+-binding EF-hand superfamily protein